MQPCFPPRRRELRSWSPVSQTREPRRRRIREPGRRGFPVPVIPSRHLAVAHRVVATLSFAAVLVNPYGPALPRVWIGLMGSQVLPRLIIEHAPTRLASIEGAMILSLGESIWPSS